MTTTYGYIRTSRQRIQGTAGSDPEAQAHQLRQEGVPEANIYRDVGVSGGTGTNSRAGWRALNARLVSGDILVVVAIDRIGRRWMDTVNAVRDLRTRPDSPDAASENLPDRSGASGTGTAGSDTSGSDRPRPNTAGRSSAGPTTVGAVGGTAAGWACGAGSAAPLQPRPRTIATAPSSAHRMIPCQSVIRALSSQPSPIRQTSSSPAPFQPIQSPRLFQLLNDQE